MLVDVARVQRTTDVNDVGNPEAPGDEPGVFRAPDIVSMHKTGAFGPGAFM